MDQDNNDINGSSTGGLAINEEEDALNESQDNPDHAPKLAQLQATKLQDSIYLIE